MAGFMGGNLGFASTFGAAIEGAAKQENQNIIQANILDNSRDLTWGTKVDKANQLYNKQKLADDDTAANHNFFMQQLKDPALADQATIYHRANPKMSAAEVVASVMPKAGTNYTADPAYGGSHTLADINARQQEQYGNITSQMSRLTPNTRNMVTTPLSPGKYSSETNSTNPSYTPTGIVPKQGTAIPNDHMNLKPDDFTDPEAYSRYAKSDPRNRDLSGLINRNPVIDKLMEKFNIQDVAPENRDAVIKSINDARRSGDPSKIRTDLIPTAQQIDQRKEDTTLSTKSNVDYLDNPKYGLGVRKSQLQDIQAQSYDLNSMVDILNRGFKSSAVQPMYDEINRYVTPILGVDLASMGVSNSVSDTNVLRKNIANAIIERLKTLHFGRITNYEADIVRQGFTNSSNDPNTNIKVTLMMKALVDQSAQGTAQEYNLAFKGGQASRENIAEARKFGMDFASRNLEGKAPWLQVNGTDPLSRDKVLALPAGTWFEDTSTGIMRQRH